jgi:hypothetical protein
MSALDQTGPIVLHVLIWTALGSALIAVMVVLLLN